MSKPHETLDLRKAFSQTPEACHQALMNAANSVSENEVKRRAPLRPALIAAILLVATLAAAIAAQQLGWADYFKRYDIEMPDAAVEQMENTEPITRQAGEVTFAYKQLLMDGRILLSAATVSRTDGAEALCMGDLNVYDAVDMVTDTIRERYHLEPETTWLDAAKRLGLPLYGVRALVETDTDWSRGDSMEDYLWDENGSITYFNILTLNSGAIPSELPVTLYMSAVRFDPDTGEEIGIWREREAATVALSGCTAKKVYRPKGDNTILLPESMEYDYADDGAETVTAIPPILLALDELRAELYPTGVYLIASFTLPEGMDEGGATEALYRLRFQDARGEELPYGISMSGGSCDVALPSASLERLCSLDALPNTIVIAGGGDEIILE